MFKGKNKKLLKSLITGSLVILGLFILGSDISFGHSKHNETKDFKDFIKDQKQSINIADSTLSLKSESIENKETYIASIDVPKIKLSTVLYDVNSRNNTVDKNIQIIKGSQMPDVNKGNLILASHSGTSNVSYFKHLDKLDLNDEVYIKYKDKKYTYKIYDIYRLEKDGTIEITRSNSSMLTLTTCDTKDDTKQLVVLASMVKEE